MQFPAGILRTDFKEKESSSDESCNFFKVGKHFNVEKTEKRNIWNGVCKSVSINSSRRNSTNDMEIMQNLSFLERDHRPHLVIWSQQKKMSHDDVMTHWGHRSRVNSRWCQSMFYVRLVDETFMVRKITYRELEKTEEVNDAVDAWLIVSSSKKCVFPFVFDSWNCKYAHMCEQCLENMSHSWSYTWRARAHIFHLDAKVARVQERKHVPSCLSTRRVNAKCRWLKVMDTWTQKLFMVQSQCWCQECDFLGLHFADSNQVLDVAFNKYHWWLMSKIRRRPLNGR